MLRSTLFCVLFFPLTFSCSPQKQMENEALEIEKEEIPSALLMHDVYFNLLDSIAEADYKMVLTEFKSLSEIESLLWLHVGQKAETGDERLNKDYDLALHVVFTSQENLDKYANDALHLQVKEKLKPFLASAPVVYDYWTVE